MGKAVDGARQGREGTGHPLPIHPPDRVRTGEHPTVAGRGPLAPIRRQRLWAIRLCVLGALSLTGCGAPAPHGGSTSTATAGGAARATAPARAASPRAAIPRVHGTVPSRAPSTSPASSPDTTGSGRGTPTAPRRPAISGPRAPTATTIAPAPPLRPVWTSAGYRNAVIVLMYHAFRQHPIPGDDITPADFAAQLARFHQDGFHVIRLSQLEAFVSGHGTVPANALLLSFDNGYASMYQYAYPLLLRYHDPATLFLIGSWLYAHGAPAGIQPLTLAETRQMLASGLISIGTQGWAIHTGVAVGPDSSEAADIGRRYNLATQRRESLAAYDQRVENDLRHAQRVLTQLGGQPVRAFAYPFGDYRPRLIHLLHLTGYRYLFTAKLGWANLQGQPTDVLYRLNVGSDGTTPADALSAIRSVAYDAARHPGYRPPPRLIEVWHP